MNDQKAGTKISNSKHKISVKYLLRVLLRALIMLPLPIIAVRFDQDIIAWLAAIFIVVVLLLQIAHAWVLGEKNSMVEQNVVRYYGKGTLTFIALFWVLLITAAAYVLYSKLPH